ncbi:MAG TPA: hypothetical protein VES73_18625, partial [Lamprocystis sp. (in: g-proteobacteria)]|nr:hypothetical protein [Lamprocystis sp. (in: g-proteobacteria)]
AHGLERFCILSATWLKRLGRFEAEVQRFVATADFSPFIEEAGTQFLRYLADDGTPLVAALARFELALHETRVDLDAQRVIEWPCDPRPVLAVILGGDDVLDEVVPGRYRVTVSRALPDGYVCEPIAESLG